MIPAKTKPRFRSAPRPVSRPLDDGARYGPEIWREIDGIAFCHWDRWLLAISLVEPGGLEGIAQQFRGRLRNRRFNNTPTEAMLAQIEDLKTRLALVGRTPGTALDEEERVSDWLRKKAEKRIWHDGPNRYTEAMHQTPRRRLMARALRGHWPWFPVSPGRFEPELRRVVGDEITYDHRATGPLASLIAIQIDLLEVGAIGDDERLALHRAAMTLIIEAMERVDDSLTELAEVFAASERTYLELARGAVKRDGILRDLLELAIWEDYGLLRGVEGFLRELDEEQANLAVRELAGIIAELRRERLEWELARAVALRREVLAKW